MRGSYRIIYTQNRPRPVVLLWPSGNLTFCLLETLGSNPDAAHRTQRLLYVHLVIGMSLQAVTLTPQSRELPSGKRKRLQQKQQNLQLRTGGHGWLNKLLQKGLWAQQQHLKHYQKNKRLPLPKVTVLVLRSTMRCAFVTFV